MADLSRVSILVVEDNTHMRQIIRTLLRGFGVGQIHERAEGGEALEFAASSPIDLIITDLTLPYLDGLSFTRMLRADRQNGACFAPIILLTAHTERSRVTAARDAGVTEVCRKPITAAELHRKIAAVVNLPRPHVRSDGFNGPDRRRAEATGGFGGAERRHNRIPIQTGADARAG